MNCGNESVLHKGSMERCSKAGCISRSIVTMNLDLEAAAYFSTETCVITGAATKLDHVPHYVLGQSGSTSGLFGLGLH